MYCGHRVSAFSYGIHEPAHGGGYAAEKYVSSDLNSLRNTGHIAIIILEMINLDGNSDVL